MKKLLLFLNKFFRKRPHPFNMKGANKLNYFNFEYESAQGVFALFEKKLGTWFWRGKSICDFACGAGGKSLWLLENGAKETVGLDASETLIKQAKEHQEGAPHIEFYVRDVIDSKLPDENFDLVVANDIMEHVAKPKETLEEAYRILKPGGKLCINFEPYYHFLGHHMWDAINIPWAHVFFSEKVRIEAYKELMKELPDGKERIKFRIDTDKKGREYIGYLNHMTIRQFKKLISHSSFLTSHFHIQAFEKFPLNLLGKTPVMQEFFCQRVICILEKK